jgi:hypothetical protein
LQLQSTQEEQLRENFRDGAEEQLKRQLVLRQFIVDEKLRVTKEDINAVVDERVSQFGDNEALLKGMRDYYLSGPGFDMLSSEVLMDKAYERIEAVLTGNAPDLAELEAEAEAAEAESIAETETEEPVESEAEAETAETEAAEAESIAEAETEEAVESEAAAETAETEVVAELETDGDREIIEETEEESEEKEEAEG